MSCLRRIGLLGVILIAWVGNLAALDLRVVGLDGEALSGARVMVIGSSGSYVADADGRLVIDPDPALPLVLYIARPDGVALKPVTII